MIACDPRPLPSLIVNHREPPPIRTRSGKAVYEETRSPLSNKQQPVSKGFRKYEQGSRSPRRKLDSSLLFTSLLAERDAGIGTTHEVPRCIQPSADSHG